MSLACATETRGIDPTVVRVSYVVPLAEAGGALRCLQVSLASTSSVSTLVFFLWLDCASSFPLVVDGRCVCVCGAQTGQTCRGASLA